MGNAGSRTVLHVIDTLEYGGAQKLLALIAQWSPAAYRHIVCVLQTDTSIRQQLEEAGATVICLNRQRPSIFRPLRFTLYTYQNIRDIMRLCSRHDVNIVQCHLSDAEFIGITAGRLAGADKILTTVHGAALLPDRPLWSFRNLLRLFATRALYRWVDHIIAVSDEVAQRLQEVFRIERSKITTVINRIDTERFARGQPASDMRKRLGLQTEHAVIATVARLSPPKGHSFLLESVSLLLPKHPLLKLLLAGDGELKESLYRQSHALHIDGCVIFLGSRSDITDILSAADIFVLPSISEGTPLALIEAMASGKPIIATNIPGIAKLIEHEKTGVLVPPGDADALAEAVDRLLRAPAMARSMGDAARSIAREKFDIRATIVELEKLWRPGT